jgi:hypothetical protein
LDHIEELSHLATSELNLRSIIVCVLGCVTKAKLTHWKQRSKVRAAIKGDKNTRYFHACANQRLHGNKIQIIEHNGSDLTGHNQKALVLPSFYLHLLGCPNHTTWNFWLCDIYPDSTPTLDCLDIPFSTSEISLAFWQMHANVSPGPDGFGPSFFKSSWCVTSPDIYALFDSFYHHSAELNRINWSYLVLLPKKDNARSPSYFRPIALQNCTIKGISKVVTTRLQPLIPSLVSRDQSSFVLGRCLVESFAYATDLLHCCYKRNAPTIILKLNFNKAFDSVQWDSLMQILQF